MQGFVMFIGVVIMLVLVLHQVGGLGNATRELAKMTPPEHGTGSVVVAGASPRQGGEVQVPEDTWLRTTDGGLVKVSDSVVIPVGKSASAPVGLLQLSSSSGPHAPDRPSAGTEGLRVDVEEMAPAAFGAGTPGVYVSAPGPSRADSLGFLTLGSAVSFFVFWAFGTAGQPSNMVRLMAFRETRTLRRSVVTVSVYFSVIYFALVVIFCCGRVLLPGWDDDSDRIMPELAAHLTAAAGVPWLAGLLLAAPFAAVMSSVDSFLLMVSSSLVRDVYQRRVNPEAAEQKLRRLAHIVTAITGVAAVLAVVNPPAQLQDLIVYASGGLGGCFLAPVTLALYWPRCNAAGVTAGLAAGFVIHTSLAVVGFVQTGDLRPVALAEIHSFVWALAGSFLITIAISRMTAPPDASIVRKFFR
jgi:Na+/proline symporter